MEASLPNELRGVITKSLSQLLVDLFHLIDRQTLHKSVRANVGALSPLSFYLSFLARSPVSRAFEQHDAAEFLHILLDRLDSELEESSNKSIISKTFQGSIHSSVRCLKCAVSFDETDSPFTELQLDVPQSNIYAEFFVNRETGEGRWVVGAPDVMDCMEHTLTQTLSGTMCSSCGSGRMERLSFLSSVPQILVLNLHPASESGVKQGESHRVEINDRIDIGPISVREGGEYDLVGVVVHNGKRASSGHYSCYSKRSSGWDYFNDSQTRRFETTSDVLMSISSQHKHAQPSLLFYEWSGPGRSKLPLYEILPLGSHELSSS